MFEKAGRSKRQRAFPPAARILSRQAGRRSHAFRLRSAAGDRKRHEAVCVVALDLQQHRLAVCQSDAADWPIWQRVTTDLVYVRLHGHERTYASGYSEEQLSTWARRARVWLAQGWAVHIYFDNDAEGAAPYDVQRLKALVG